MKKFFAVFITCTVLVLPLSFRAYGQNGSKHISVDLGKGDQSSPTVIDVYQKGGLVYSITLGAGPVNTTVSKSADSAAVELEFWSSIKSSTNPEDFNAYLKKYPNGEFADLARNRLKTAGTSTVAAGPPLSMILGFESVLLDAKGEITGRQKDQSKALVEDLGGVGLEMMEIPGGSILMGSSENEIDLIVKEYERYGIDPAKAADFASWEAPMHKVTVPGFYIGRFEVTQAQWRAVAGLPKVNSELNPDPSSFKGDNLPVESVTWDDAMEFCARLSKKTGREYRLPTEAEWEYACRAKTTTPFSFGETITTDIVNYNGNYPYNSAPKVAGPGKTVPVGSLGEANKFGLFDMHGNVWEWCLDNWHDNYKGAPSDGSAWKGGDGSNHVLRGGSWFSSGILCRSARRYRNTPDLRADSRGLRVVMAH